MPKGTTSTDAGHSHFYNVDASGNGKTSTDGKHLHLIEDWKVLPSADGHVHTIPREA